MRKIKLILGTYNSIPYNYKNTDNLYLNNLRPFLQLLNSYPELCFTSYYSGILLEWLENKHPEFLMLTNDLVKENKIELLGGAFYEPVFSIIPSKDRVGQIEEMTTLMRKRFSKRPRGIWLPQQVWEPGYPGTLSTCGIDYTFIENSFFSNNGISKGASIRPYVTEDQGKMLKVFPLHNNLLPELSKFSASTAVEKLMEFGDDHGKNVISCLVPGELIENKKEKTGINIKWMEKFLTELSKNRSRIETILPSKYCRIFDDFEKIYIPCLNYTHMKKRILANSSEKVQKKLEQILNSTISSDLLSGGFFREFLLTHTESNKLYSKMMHINVLINQIKGDKSRKKSAREELWKGQHNSAFWTGDKHGIENAAVRANAYNALIEAEKLSRESGVFDSSLMLTDFDMDGRDECIYQGQAVNAYIHAHGGCIFEFDYINKPWNYINPYRSNNKNCKSSEYAFIDHFLENEETPSNFSKYEHTELADFHNKKYSFTVINKEQMEIICSAEGYIKKKSSKYAVSIEKRFKFMKRAVNVIYTITNNSGNEIQCSFGSEINMNFELFKEALTLEALPAGKEIDLTSRINQTPNVLEFKINHQQKKNTIAIQSAEKFKLWSMPKIFKNDYQYSRFLLNWKLKLEPKAVWTNKITLRLERLKK